MKRKFLILNIILLVILTLIGLNINKVVAEEQYKYLYEYKNIYTKVGYSDLKIDKGIENGEDVALQVDFKKRSFKHGIVAHADSEIVYLLNSDITTNNFDEFRVYIGNSYYRQDKGDGVKFKIFTGNKKNNITDVNDKGNYYWTLKYNQDTPLKGDNNAVFLKIDIKNCDAIRLVSEKNINKNSDHSTYANPILCKTDYQESTLDYLKEEEYYKNKYKDFDYINNDITEIKIDLFKYYLVKNIGYYTINDFARENEDNKIFIDYLFTDIEFLSLFILGGKPQSGNYLEVFKVLTRLYKEHKADLYDNSYFENSTTIKSKLYKKMMISIALVYDQGVYSQFNSMLGIKQVGSKRPSDPLKRYEIYKFLRNNKTSAEENSHDYLDIKVFDSLEVEYMRWVFDTEMHDDEILWINYQSRKKKNFNGEFSIGGYDFVPYTDGNAHQVFVDEKRLSVPGDLVGEENFKIYEKKYELDKFGITNDQHVRLWVTHEVGQVCGGISKNGCAFLASVGRPSNVVGQPGHGAYINYYYDKNLNSFRWKIDNNISGIQQSERWQRMPLDIRKTGNNTDIKPVTYNMPHMYLTQLILNDYDNYEKTFLLDILADFKNDLNEKIKIYEKSLEYQELNFLTHKKLLILYGQISKYNDFSFTYDLFEKLSNSFINYPMAIRDYYFLITKYITDSTLKFSIDTSYITVLEKIKTSNNDFIYKNEIKNIAKYYLGQTEEIATFTFSGKNKNKIILNNSFKGTSFKVRYSIDSGLTYKEEQDLTEIPLTDEQLDSITEEGIWINFVGTTQIYKIPINYQHIDIKKIKIDTINKKIITSYTNLLVGINEDKFYTLNEFNYNLSDYNKLFFKLNRYDKFACSFPISIDYEIVAKNLNLLINPNVEIISAPDSTDEYNINNLIDDNIDSYYKSIKNKEEKEIIFKFNNSYNITKILYLGSNKPNHSNFKNFKIFYSNDNISYFALNENYEVINYNDNYIINCNLKNISYIKITLQNSNIIDSNGDYSIGGNMLCFYTPDKITEYKYYYDFDLKTILHKVELSDTTIPEPKNSYTWYKINETKYALMDISKYNNLEDFTNNFKFPLVYKDSYYDLNKIDLLLQYEIINDFLHIKDNKLYLKDKNITEEKTITIELVIKLPFEGLVKKVEKTITFTIENPEELEYIILYDEKGKEIKHIKKDKNISIPEPKEGYVWYEITKLEKQLVKKEKIEQLDKLKNNFNFPTLSFNEVAEIPLEYNIIKYKIKELNTNHLTINNNKISLKNKNIKEDSVKITVEIQIKDGIINQTLQKELIFSKDKNDSNISTGGIISIVFTSLFIILFIPFIIFIIIKKKKNSNN